MNISAGLYSELGYENRLTKLEAEFPGANILLHKLGRLPKVFCFCYTIFVVYFWMALFDWPNSRKFNGQFVPDTIFNYFTVYCALHL